MSRKLSGTIAALAFVLATFLTATTALAGDPTNVAGRPLNGIGFGSGSSCHGTIYGRINGSMVLFYARHCYPNPNTPVPGINGAILGTTNYDVVSIADSDMGFIWLNSSSIPTDKNRMYVGADTFENDRKKPSTDATCGDMYTSGIKIGYRTTLTDGYGPWTHSVIDWNSAGIGCELNSGLDKYLGPNNIPSGAPAFDTTTGEFIGVASYASGGNIWVNHWREAMLNLQDYYGADDTFFCNDSACQ